MEVHPDGSWELKSWWREAALGGGQEQSLGSPSPLKEKLRKGRDQRNYERAALAGGEKQGQNAQGKDNRPRLLDLAEGECWGQMAEGRHKSGDEQWRDCIKTVVFLVTGSKK